MNEDFCDFVLQFLDKAHIPGKRAMPAGLNLPRRLDPEEVFVIPGMQSITMSTLVGSSETVY